MREMQVQSLGREDPWSRKHQPPPVFLPGESHGQMSQAGYSPWGHKESIKTEHTCRHKHFRATVCPGNCRSACFFNTSNFFLLHLPVENHYILSFTGITGPSYQLKVYTAGMFVGSRNDFTGYCVCPSGWCLEDLTDQIYSQEKMSWPWVP